MTTFRFRLNRGTHHGRKDKLFTPGKGTSDCPKFGFQPGDIIETETDLVAKLDSNTSAKRFELISPLPVEKDD